MVSSNIMPYRPLLIFLVIILIWYITSTKNVSTESFGGNASCSDLSYISDCSDASSDCSDHWSWAPTHQGAMRCNPNGSKCSYKTNTAKTKVNKNHLCKDTPSGSDSDSSSDTERCNDNRASNKGQQGACRFDTRCKDNRAKNKDMGWPGANDINKCSFDTVCKAENEPLADNRISRWPGSHAANKCKFPKKCRDSDADNYEANSKFPSGGRCDFPKKCRDADADNYVANSKFPSGGKCDFPKKCRDNRADNYVANSKFPSGGKCDFPKKCIKSKSKKNGKYAEGAVEDWPGPHDASLCKYKGCNDSDAVNSGKYDFSDEKDCIYPKKCKDKNAEDYDSKYENKKWFKNQAHDEKWCKYDKTPPTIQLNDGEEIKINVGTKYNEPGGMVIDDMDTTRDIETSEISGLDKINTNTVDQYSIMYNVEDKRGNKAQKERIVNVLDLVAPKVSLVGSKSIRIPVGENAYTEYGVDVSDNYDTDLKYTTSVSGSGSIVNANKVGQYKVEYSALDSSRNLSNTVSRNVTVFDKVKPNVSIKGANPLTIPVGKKYTEYGVNISDNYDKNLKPIISGVSNIKMNVPGNYTVTYKGTDKSGNIATKTREVKIVDNKPPTIKLNNEDTIFLGVDGKYREYGAVVSDNVSKKLKATISGADQIIPGKLGTYYVTYTTTDTAGNTTTKDRTVIIRDQTAPSIRLNGDKEIEIPQYGEYIERGGKVTDNRDKYLAPIISGDTVDTTTRGEYIVKYQGIDRAEVPNKTDIIERLVKVVDKTPPQISLYQPDYPGKNGIDYGNDYIEFKAHAVDDDGVLLDNKINMNGTVNTKVPGSYTIQYSVTDDSGNKSETIERNVIVNQKPDTISPQIVLKNPIYPGEKGIEVGIAGTDKQKYIEYGAHAMDDDGTILDGKVQVSGYVDTNIVGEYTVRYSISDKSGNSAEIERAVYIVDTTKPTITLKGKNPMIVPQGTPYKEPGANALDNGKDISKRIKITGHIDTSVEKTYVLTYRVKDYNGHITRKNRTVHVIDQYRILCKEPVYRNLACEDLEKDVCGGDDVSALYGEKPFHCIFKDYKCQKGPSCGKRPGMNEEDWLQRLGHRYNTD